LELPLIQMPPIILASNSPRRRELLALSGLPFVILPVNVDENLSLDEDPEECVRRLAELKMRAALELANRMGFSHDQMVLSSDTIVVYERKILGKPKDIADAEWMLKTLRGKTHQVLTAIQIATVDSSKVVSDLCTSNVKMRKYTDAEIQTYIQTCDPMDKAGAYAIQHSIFHPAEHFDECYASVMGLPLCHVTRSLIKFGIRIYEDIPVVCQQSLNYTCPVFTTILEDSGMK
jgi:septum formation protein